MAARSIPRLGVRAVDLLPETPPAGGLVLSGAGDNYAANSAHNGQFYVRPDGRVIFLPHDMDFSFSTSRSITANSDVSTIVNDPPRMRQYLGHLHDIITTTYNNRDELRTIFVTGFPQDVRERELMNLCRLMPGYEVRSSHGGLPCLCRG